LNYGGGIDNVVHFKNTHNDMNGLPCTNENLTTHSKIATSNQQACKGKNATIFQNTLNTKKCIKSFQNTTYNF